jgi:riboflavin synthase
LFTGIIEEIGTVVNVQKSGDIQRTAVKAPGIIGDMEIGDSVSIDGVCQTVVDLNADHLLFESVRETLARTTLGGLRRGDRVNVERSMQLRARFGGHLVMGHVDGVGTIIRRIDRREGALFAISLTDELMRYVVPRGSIAVDGISLTVVSVFTDGFDVSIIPYTLGHTTLCFKRARHRVNLEVDLLARYVERIAQWGLRNPKSEMGDPKPGGPQRGITAEGLKEMGF